MKAKKLPKKNSGTLFLDEQAMSKPGVKLSKQKRFKKPSIYDEMDDYDETLSRDQEIDDSWSGDESYEDDDEDR